MDKKELIETLEDSHQELLEMLEGLPEVILTEPGVTGTWSIKDILAHLTYWEGQTVTLLFQMKRGMPKPTTVHFGDEPVDALNERWHAQGKDRPLAMVWSDFVGVRKQTVRRVSEFSDEDLQNPARFAWLKGKPLWEFIVSDTVTHEEEHADAIRDWLDRRDDSASGANSSNGSRPG